MIKKIGLSFILFYVFTVSFNSCKKDLDHDLDYNIFDSAYKGPEPVSIIDFEPIYSIGYLRNILRIKLGYNINTLNGSKVHLYRDSIFFLSLFTDTGTIATDYHTLPGETHLYQTLILYKGSKTKLTTPQPFTMY